MKALVLYESVYGNTEAIAKAIGDGLRPISDVTVARFGDVPNGAVEAADLVVLGGPTHGWGMTRPDSRSRPDAEGYDVGVREWLEASRHVGEKMVAAFDTRFGKPRWLTGSAALRVARRLRRSGVRLLAPPESFFVLHTAGPLEDGEEDRARAWGAELGRLGTQHLRRSNTGQARV